jgi:hypothetical protein
MSDEQNKPPQTARDRLAQISHHFLSDDDVSDNAGSGDEGSEQAPKNDVYTLAVLNTENDGNELPVSLLSQQLATRGRSAAILDSSVGMNMVSFIRRNDNQQARTVHHGPHHHTLEDDTRRPDNKSHDVHFLLVDTPESSCLSFADKVLVTAPATPEGLQRTYLSIKQLAAYHKAVQVGVTITGTSNATRAEDCFNRLATAVHRFLERDLLSYGYLPAPSGLSGHTKAPHTAQMSLTRSGITTIAELISDEIGEWEQNNVRDDRQKTQPINPAPTNDAKGLIIKSVAITSDDDLLELVTDALPNLLGNSYELVSDDLPFDGNHILALDAKKQSFVISCDNHDGGRALQYGLSMLEGMSENREIIKRLYPTVFNSHGQSQFRIEDTHLIVLSPNPPPGGAYLTHALSCLSFYTFHALQIDDRIGLFIEPCFTHKDSTVRHRNPISDKIAHDFRGGKTVLSQEETAFFQST